jgi:glucosamine--fructose-6-phosphate aminotransferase (isomerizing)
MCGIFGYVGEKNPVEVCIQALKLLEYRGYDSSGFAGIEEGQVRFCKEAGKLSNLEKEAALRPLRLANVIGHTRWATHGAITRENAHPHTDEQRAVALVHNGIIENYAELKAELEQEGVRFSSETDTEVIAQLIARAYQGSLVEAVHSVMGKLRGHFAIAAIHKNHPGEIVGSACECPLSIGTASGEAQLCSDPNAFIGGKIAVRFLKKGEIVRVTKGRAEIFDAALHAVERPPVVLDGETKPLSKEGYAHFMLKEIFEQPQVIQRALLGRIDGERIVLEEAGFSLAPFRRFLFIGCGTSYHAGLLGTYLFQDLAGLGASCEIASEARYRSLVTEERMLAVAVSQSGETADTLAAVRVLQEQKIPVLGICNVKNSTLTREGNGCIFMQAGPEVSVCSTKAFLSQLALITLLALRYSPSPTPLTRALISLPDQIGEVLEQSDAIARIAERYAHYPHFFFIGRQYMYGAALESALKLKEISYINANAYPGGELKHGPLALIHSQFPVAAFCANKKTEEKIVSNIMEVKARGAPVIAFAPRSASHLGKIADDAIWLPDLPDPLAPFASAVAGQLFAYHVARLLGRDIDQPLNLAKSVTVE